MPASVSNARANRREGKLLRLTGRLEWIGPHGIETHDRGGSRDEYFDPFRGRTWRRLRRQGDDQAFRRNRLGAETIDQIHRPARDFNLGYRRGIVVYQRLGRRIVMHQSCDPLQRSRRKSQYIYRFDLLGSRITGEENHQTDERKETFHGSEHRKLPYQSRMETAVER